MHEELENFERNQVWTLIDPPHGVNVIDTKWVLKNKKGEDNEVVRNKTHLVAQGYCQVEGQDFGKIFAPVTCLDGIMILLAFATFKGFKLYQMDMKSVFINSVMQEEVFVKQPPGFENPKYPSRIYKVSIALYGLKQASMTWYAKLKSFLLEHGYAMSSVDKTLFTLKCGNDFLLVQIYMDAIIFGGSSHSLVSSFQEMIVNEFQMSMMEELTFFLGIHVKQTKEGTFVHQAKYMKDLIKKFVMVDAKPVPTSMSMTITLDPNEDGQAVDQREYKSMISSLLYLTTIRPDIQFTMCLCACF
jgi:hypothetical protein